MSSVLATVTGDVAVAPISLADDDIDEDATAVWLVVTVADEVLWLGSLKATKGNEHIIRRQISQKLEAERLSHDLNEPQKSHSLKTNFAVKVFLLKNVKVQLHLQCTF